jgi:hypothetical protein
VILPSFVAYSADGVVNVLGIKQPDYATLPTQIGAKGLGQRITENRMWTITWNSIFVLRTQQYFSVVQLEDD